MSNKGNPPCRILLLEPDQDLSAQLVLALRRRLPGNALLRTATNLQEASIWTCMEHFHAALVADMLPDGLGAEFLAKLSSRHGQSICLFLLVGGNPNESKAVEVLHAYPDVRYIEKPLRFQPGYQIYRRVW